jgi:hypothetical protein
VTATRELRGDDLRVAGGLMLAAAATRPWWSAASGWGGPPCPLRSITGIPCPFCGMTTSVTAAVHGHLGDALAANPLGIVAVVLAAAAWVIPRRRRVRVPDFAVYAALAAAWAWELARYW